MQTVPLPEERFTAHTVQLEEDEFALSILLDGRSPSDDSRALMLQFAIDPRDGDEPYLEIPIQQFASDGGLRKFSISGNCVVVSVDGVAGERLGGVYGWTVQIPADRRTDLIEFSKRAFSRHQELLEIKEP